MTEAGEPAAALDRPVVRALAERALIEDSAWHDVTTAATVPPEQEGRAAIRARASGVICGLTFGEAVYGLLDARVQWLPAVDDGAAVEAGACVAELRGPLGAILRGERVTLNFLQRLSGIATTTRVAVEAGGAYPGADPGHTQNHPRPAGGRTVRRADRGRD